MANLQYVASANLDVSGITPTSGPKPSLKVSSVYTSGGVAVGDHIADTFVVNGSTPATAIDLGELVTGKAVWIEASAPIHLILTQDLGAGPVDITYPIDKFMFSQTTFTAVKLANPTAVAINVSIAVMGDRAAVGVGPGIY